MQTTKHTHSKGFADSRSAGTWSARWRSDFVGAVVFLRMLLTAVSKKWYHTYAKSRVKRSENAEEIYR